MNIRQRVTGNGRGAFRLRRMFLSATSIMGAKGISLLVMLVSVPLTYNYLGEERFGLLMLILSLIMLMTFADLGLGYGLLNKIATYDLAGDMRNLRRAVSSTFFFLAATGLILLLTYSALHTLISWNTVFNVVSPLASYEAGWSILLFVVCFCMTLPFTIVAKFQAGYQENHINQIWEAAGNLFGLGALIVAVQLEAGVPFILLALYGSQCLFIVLNFCFQFFVRRPHLMPGLQYWDTHIFRSVFRDAMMICGLQIFSMLINAIDSVLIARYIDPVAVGAYAIAYRLFSIFILPVQAFLSSILPAFNDAFAGKDLIWIRKGFNRALIGVIGISAVLSLLFITSANFLVRLWIAPDVHLALPLVAAFGAYIVYQNISSLLFNTMMSPIFLRRLFALFGIAAALIIVLKIVFINMFHFSSVLWATMLGATLIFLLPGYQYVYKQLFVSNAIPAQRLTD